MTVALSAGLIATVFTVINFLKYLSNKQWNSALTQLIVWVGGFGVVWLAAQTTMFGVLQVSGIALRSLNLAELVFVGLNVGSGGTTFNEVRKALDNTDTSITPKLFPKVDTPKTSTRVHRRAP